METQTPKTPPLLTKEQAEEVRQKGLDYSGQLIELQERVTPISTNLQREYTEVIKKLAEASALLAALSLTLFSSKIILIKSLLIWGVALLLVNVVIAFFHLVRRYTKEFAELNEFNDNLTPHRELSHNPGKVLRGEMSYEAWQKSEKENILLSADMSAKKVVYTAPKVSHTDEIILTILSVAVGFIILSFLIPYLFPKFIN